MDSRDRFGEVAAPYDEYRPDFPPELFDWIVATAGIAPPARVADIGSGTGIATRLWSERGFDVVGVEPNESMREVAAAASGDSFHAGDACSTGLPDHAFDLVASAQAFHYFELDPTLREWARILVPGGACTTFWYRIATSRVKLLFRDLRRRFGSRTSDYVTKKKKILATLEQRPELRDLVSKVFRYEQVLDLDGWRGRVLASSRLRDGPRTEEFDREVEAAFARCEEGGRIRIPLEATAVLWRFR